MQSITTGLFSTISGGASEAGVGHLVETLLMDMAEIPLVFKDIDLLWSEGAAYNIGFENALRTWAPAMRIGGFMVLSELALLSEGGPQDVMDFLFGVYPSIQTTAQNIASGRGAGLRSVDTYTLPREAWVEGYYDVLGPRAEKLLNHPDSSVREMAVETLREIDIFKSSGDSYGYVFYIFERVV